MVGMPGEDGIREEIEMEEFEMFSAEHA